MTDQFPENWAESFSGGDADNLKVLQGFENPEAFGTAFFEQSAAAKVAADVNWRAQFAGDDEKRATQLERYTTPEDFGKSFFEKDAKIRAGDALKPLAENATDDDVKAFREQQGIPLEASEYLENLPEGLVIGEDDKPIIADFMNKLHALNVPPAVAHATVEWYNEFQEQQQAAIREQDKAHEDETTDVLRDKWGSEYRININIAKAALAQLPEEKRAMFLDARMSDNRALFNDPDIMGWLAGIGRQVNPTATIVGAGEGSDKAVDVRIAEIEATMGTPAYTKDEKVQAELRRLYDIVGKREAA